MNTHRVRHLSLFTAAALVGVLALAGCSGSGSDDATDSSADADGGSTVADRDALPDGADRAAAESAYDAGVGGAEAKPAALTDVAVGQHLIKTGSVDMEADDIQQVVDRIYALAKASSGSVTAESTTTGDDDALDHARMEIRVPVAGFDRAIDEIQSWGVNAESDTQTVDVTGKVANVDSRVRSAEQSIAQLRLLFDRATRLGQIISLERELSRRQADLEALEAQQRALRSQTSLSTILVTVRLVDQTVGEPADENQDGFVAGIKQGWDGFVTFVVGASHAVGLVLPFALFAGVLGWLGWWAARRFRPPGRGSVPPAQPTGASTD